MGILNRVFGLRDFKSDIADTGTTASTSKGNELLGIAVDLLTTQIDLGDASPGGPNRQRLENPYARGYLFGFVDALLRRGGVTNEQQVLALISVAHRKLFGNEAGSKFIGEAFSDQASISVFGPGRAAGAADLSGWLSDRKVPPLMLSDYLKGRDLHAGTD